MKSYSEYMEEISSDKLYEGLLGYGLFSEKLPPIFTSESFFGYCKNNNIVFSKGEHDYISWESMRNINIPRLLSIPNPMAYQKLCKCLSDNWENLKKHFQRQTADNDYKISRIHIRKKKNNKSLFEMNYNNWKEDGTPSDDLLIGKKYITYADISTCFPSIYTHSISWALVGKDVAKQERNNGWFNDIDKMCQNLRNGETHGIMIGPHASNLISEIILTVVDKKLFSKGWQYFRNIDDYTCYTKSIEESEKFLRDLNHYLKEFDLPMNHKKTQIKELPVASAEQWVRKLNAFSLVASYGKVSYKEAQAYFDLTVELMSSNAMNAAILNYAIKVLAKQNLTENAKSYCLKESMHLSLIYPYLVPLLEKYVFNPYGVTSEQVKHYSDMLYETSNLSDNFEGMCYAVYYSLKYNFDLSDIDAEKILKKDNCLLMLLGMLYFKKRKDKVSCRKFRDYAKVLKNVDMDRNWLYIYETLSKGNLSGEWKTLKENKISFLKPEFKYE